MIVTIIYLSLAIILALYGVMAFGFAMKRSPDIAFGFFHNILAGVVAAILVSMFIKFKDTTDTSFIALLFGVAMLLIGIFTLITTPKKEKS